MTNENMHMSAAGLDALRQREGAILRYYNDIANNCTYGIGTLVHHGPCPEEGLRRPVSIADVDAQLATRVSTAEAAVRRQVRDQQLTQEQFDALVSFAFNTGAAGAQTVLGAVNRGVFEAAATQMNNTVYIHLRDANGHLIILFAYLALSCLAWKDSVAAQQERAALEKLSRLSGLPETELLAIVADCHADQQHMYFCAWRDQIAADLIFKEAVIEKMKQLPNCKDWIENKSAEWAISRDNECAKSARNEWGKGSMRATAQAICMAMETKQMQARLKRMNKCKPL
jgi:lysozyme